MGCNTLSGLESNGDQVEGGWMYRVAEVQYGREKYYDVREYYDFDPDDPMWSLEGVAPLGAVDIDDLIWALETMLKEAKKAKEDPGRMLRLDPKGDRV